MVLGVFSLLHNAIASINDNDITDRQVHSIYPVRAMLQSVASTVLNPKLRTAVYNSFVQPTLEYVVLVWMCGSTSVLSRLSSLQQHAPHTIGSGCYRQSLEIRRTIGALCYLYKLHSYSFPAIFQALLPAAKTLPLADLLTWEQLNASTKHSFIGIQYYAPFLTACPIRGTIFHLVYLNMHLAAQVSRRSS